MVMALHCDGLVLLMAALGLLWLGVDYRRWQFRVPIIAMAACDFALALHMLGLYRPAIAATWLWLRLLADISVLVIIALYLAARWGHPRVVPRQMAK